MALTAQSIANKINKTSKDMAAKSMKSALALGEINFVEYVDIEKTLRHIEEYDLLVGIPDASKERNEKGRSQITNVELAYIHTHGSTTSKARQKVEENIRDGYDLEGARKLALELWESKTGSPFWRIPPRPIIEPAIEANQDKLNPDFAKILGLMVAGNFEGAEKQMNATGMRAQNFVRNWFVDPRNNWPPNTPATIAMKGSDKPLIDTGQLRKSITYVIRKPENKLSKRVIKSIIKVNQNFRGG